MRLAEDVAVLQSRPHGDRTLNLQGLHSKTRSVNWRVGITLIENFHSLLLVALMAYLLPRGPLVEQPITRPSTRRLWIIFGINGRKI